MLFFLFKTQESRVKFHITTDIMGSVVRTTQCLFNLGSISMTSSSQLIDAIIEAVLEKKKTPSLSNIQNQPTLSSSASSIDLIDAVINANLQKNTTPALDTTSSSGGLPPLSSYFSSPTGGQEFSISFDSSSQHVDLLDPLDPLPHLLDNQE